MQDTRAGHRSQASKRFRHNAQVVEAVQFDGTAAGAARLEAFAGTSVNRRADAARVEGEAGVRLVTMFGQVLVRPTDWVVRTAQGRFAAMSEGVFMEQHEAIGG